MECVMTVEYRILVMTMYMYGMGINTGVFPRLDPPAEDQMDI